MRIRSSVVIHFRLEPDAVNTFGTSYNDVYNWGLWCNKTAHDVVGHEATSVYAMSAVIIPNFLSKFNFTEMSDQRTDTDLTSHFNSAIDYMLAIRSKLFFGYQDLDSTMTKKVILARCAAYKTWTAR